MLSLGSIFDIVFFVCFVEFFFYNLSTFPDEFTRGLTTYR